MISPAARDARMFWADLRARWISSFHAWGRLKAEANAVESALAFAASLVNASAVTDLAPGFLVAVPQLGDPNFQRALIMLIEHSESGAIGLVVNRLASVHLGEVAKSQKLPFRPEMIGAPVFVGGPVQSERGFVLHARPDVVESVEVGDGLFVSSSMESLRQLMDGPVGSFRLCLGYAGWDAGQLEKELQEGAWITAPLTRKHVLQTPAKQSWDAVLRDMGIDPAMLLHGGGLH
jgi:putative transcriptional regulator